MSRKRVLDKARNRIDHKEAASRLRSLGYSVPKTPKTKSEKDRIRRLYNKNPSIVENSNRYVAVKVGKDAILWREKGAIVQGDRVIVWRGDQVNNRRTTYSRKTKSINIRGGEQNRTMRIGEIKPKPDAIYGITVARGGQIYTTVAGRDLEAFLKRYERERVPLIAVELPDETDEDGEE
jgi:hypothetical protein